MEAAVEDISLHYPRASFGQGGFQGAKARAGRGDDVTPAARSLASRGLRVYS